MDPVMRFPCQSGMEKLTVLPVQSTQVSAQASRVPMAKRMQQSAPRWNGWRISKNQIVWPSGISFPRRSLKALGRIDGTRERQEQ